MRYSVFTAIFLFLFCAESVAAQENPFIQMAGEPYSRYFEYLEGKVYRNIEQRDLMWVKHTVAQMREAAKVSKNKKWTLEADFCEAMYRFRRGQLMLHKPNQKQMDSLGAIFTDKMLSIVQQAKKNKAFDVELRAMYRVWDFYGYHLKNYEMAFRYGLEFDNALSKVSAAEFPIRPHYYAEIGKLYYYFQEYETALIYFEKGLEGTAMTHNLSITNYIKTLWNNKGLIYRNHYNDLDKSDSCFLQILKIEIQNLDQQSVYDSFHTRKEYELWRGIAKGNLGTNHYLRGEYDQAIPLLQFSIEKAVEYNDFNFPYAIGKAILLAEIFIELSDLPQAKFYLDKAADFLDRLQKRSSVSDVKTNIELWVDYYKMMRRYYRMAGDNAQALLYVDSTEAMYSELEDEVNLRKLHRVEQQVNQEKLDAEIFRSKTYFRVLIISSLFSLLLIAFSLLLYRLYRQKQSAYKDLTVRTKQWAELPVTATETETALPDQKNKLTFDALTQLMTDKHLYRNHDITLEHTAKLLGVNRVYLSQTINCCKGDNFNNFVNECRIKEAVKLMSDKENNHLSIEGIAIDVGFNDRKSFYRAFKRFTGLSPSEFRNNLWR